MRIKLTSTTVGAATTKNLFSGLNVNTAKVNVGNAEYEELIAENSADITIGVFMDGTLNNRDNTNARIAYEKADKSKKLPWRAELYKGTIDKFEKDSIGSYENDLSNVARMEPAYQKITTGKLLQDRVYIEGIGSVNFGRDDEDGMAYGTGATGIPKKVEKACIEASKKISSLYDDNDLDKINILQIDVFGFSRGAAAARNFVHEITLRMGHDRTIFDDDDDDEKKEKKGKKYKLNCGELGVQLNKALEGRLVIRRLVIRFAGLYETVASYGMNHTGTKGFAKNDAIQLHLNSISKALNVFQLIAQDEHRENFTITNINSAGIRGLTKFIPGVHSDIGGGYTDNYKENNLIIFTPPSLNYFKKLKLMHSQLIAESWYKADELSTDANNNLLVNKTIKSKKYSYIPLHIMVEYAIKKKVWFEFTEISKKYYLNEITQTILPSGEVYITTLKRIKERLDKHVNDSAARMNMNDKNDEKMLRLIRANYIHTSSHYNDKVAVGMYAPHKPYDSYLTRRRKNDING